MGNFTVLRRVGSEDARPGDRFTISGMVVKPGERGVYRSELGSLLMRDLDGDIVSLEPIPDLDIKIERELVTTSDEPSSLGAIVRTLPPHGFSSLVYVRSSKARGPSWTPCYGDRRWTWDEILDRSVSGVVEVLHSGMEDES